MRSILLVVVITPGSAVDIGVIGEVAEDVQLAFIRAIPLLHVFQILDIKHVIASFLKLVYYSTRGKGSGWLYDITKNGHLKLCIKSNPLRRYAQDSPSLHILGYLSEAREGGVSMRVVVVKFPKALCGLMRRIFGMN